MHTHLDAGQEHTGNFAASLAEAVVLGIVVDLAQTIARHAIPRGGRIATLFDQQFPPCAAVDVISAMDDEKIALYLYSIACVSFTLFAAQRQLSLAKN